MNKIERDFYRISSSKTSSNQAWNVVGLGIFSVDVRNL